MSGETSGVWRRRLAAAVLGLTLTPLLVVGLAAEWRRFTGRGLEARIAFLADDEEARIRRALGDEYPLYAAVADTPEDAVIAVRAPMQRDTFLKVMHLETLLFPRRVDYLHAVSGLFVSKQPESRPFFVLDLRPGTEFPWQDRFAVVEQDSRFTLWRLRPEAQ